MNDHKHWFGMSLRRGSTDLGRIRLDLLPLRHRLPSRRDITLCTNVSSCITSDDGVSWCAQQVFISTRDSGILWGLEL